MEICFILVEPATPENVGAAARALKTMGFASLRLVNPCDYLSPPARWLAHASSDILENATVFHSLEEALHDIDFKIGTTAKKRSVKNDYFPLPDLPDFLTRKKSSLQKTAVVFGREESGLTNEELKLCDLVTTVPLQTSYPSLNLAQAVMLYCYELSKLNYITTEKANKNEQGFSALKEKIKTVLHDTGFKENTNIYPRFFERLNFLGEDDIHLLHSFCNKYLQNKK
ncbi:MAG: tRNA/rRNA methyltransferase [Prolixibacteraceae bacterium]|nr:tRNA/rRNA methyltransferase [Prolixibacteraceae bacterium]